MADSKLTIVFRGLMVFHKTAGPSSLFEVGLLSPCHHHHGNPHHIPSNPPHIPRINTYKNGVLDSVTFLRDFVDPMFRIWELKVTGGVGGVETEEYDGTFYRERHTNTRDYRWLIDLEDPREFHGPLTGKIDTKQLNPVLRIPSGKFYTRLLSRKMKRRQAGGQETDFGRVSAAVGCDITLTGTKAELIVDRTKENGTNEKIFTFDVDQNTLYEIANTPPDTHESNGDHFHHYYDIFTSFVKKFEFSPGEALTGPSPGGPAPSPALCGGVRLGTMKEPL